MNLYSFESVLGTITEKEMGHTQPHEHVYIVGTIDQIRCKEICINNFPASMEELKLYKEAGGSAVVDANPLATGRDALALKDLSRLTGVQILATTGYTDEQKKEFTEASKEIPVFFSANMSLGINLIIALAKKATKLLEGNFDIEIVERHHNQKIDAPSGTALAIADAIDETLSYPAEYVYDRHAVRRKRKPTEIGIHAVRGGTIVGDHEVIFAGTDEVIELKHSAHSKEVFAVGAIKAAKFMSDKPAGMYSMNDLISTL